MFLCIDPGFKVEGRPWPRLVRSLRRFYAKRGPGCFRIKASPELSIVFNRARRAFFASKMVLKACACRSAGQLVWPCETGMASELPRAEIGQPENVLPLSTRVSRELVRVSSSPLNFAQFCDQIEWFGTGLCFAWWVDLETLPADC